jgi:6-phosphofructokinase
MKVMGISDGFTGLIHKEYRELSEKDLSGILTMGEPYWEHPGRSPLKAAEKARMTLKSLFL